MLDADDEEDFEPISVNTSVEDTTLADEVEEWCNNELRVYYYAPYILSR